MGRSVALGAILPAPSPAQDPPPVSLRSALAMTPTGIPQERARLWKTPTGIPQERPGDDPPHRFPSGARAAVGDAAAQHATRLGVGRRGEWR